MPDPSNVQQVVPFLSVSNMEASLKFYVEGLGFAMTKHWLDEGKVRWCWLELGGAALMLQEYRPPFPAHPGEGVSINFTCRDAIAIYHEARARAIDASTPFVGNSMWVTIMRDPDGYKLDFESYTDVPEETLYQEAR
jgi:lactoylglutathione lyase